MLLFVGNSGGGIHVFLFACLDVCVCLFSKSAAVILSLDCLWSLNIMIVSVKDHRTPMLASVLAFDNTSVCGTWKFVCMWESWSPYLELLALSFWAAVFPSSSRFSIVNEEDRRERGLLVLIYPGGSLGITINSQLLAHSTGLHRHCQFVPIRKPSFWMSAVKGCLGPTGELPGPGLGLTTVGLAALS